MRFAIVSIVAFVLIGGAIVSRAAPVTAHQATPAIGSVGVSGGAVGSGEPDGAPGFMLSLRRGVFEPGGVVPLHHHPGALVIYVESGELTYTVSEGEAMLTRAAQAGTPAPTERIGPGDAVLLLPGDTIYEEGVVHVTENQGDEPATIWIASLSAVDQPLTLFHEATPTP
ncbi:MAG: cupin domain-containing protein [Chloroflexia bacterium]|nr:cupin domain-containing protein [Chloroflexia bacterium]